MLLVMGVVYSLPPETEGAGVGAVEVSKLAVDALLGLPRGRLRGRLVGADTEEAAASE
jgi:hypothetical protein